MTSRIDLVAQNGNIGHADYLEMQERLKALAIAIPEWPTAYGYDSVDLYDDGVEFRTKGEGEFDRYQWEVARKELIAAQERELNQSEQHLDMVNSPPHYQLRPGYEVYDLRQDLARKANNISLPHDLYSDWDRAIEYLIRCWEKNDIEDIKKARWYLNKLIEKLEADEDAATR